jgi:hypothetical protein
MKRPSQSVYVVEMTRRVMDSVTADPVGVDISGIGRHWTSSGSRPATASIHRVEQAGDAVQGGLVAALLAVESALCAQFHRHPEIFAPGLERCTQI